MTFPRDHTEDAYNVEDHSPISIVAVSLAMIGVALVAITSML